MLVPRPRRRRRRCGRVAETLRAAIGDACRCALDDGSELDGHRHRSAARSRSRHGGARRRALVDRADRALYAGKRRGATACCCTATCAPATPTGEDSDLLHTAQALALAVSHPRGRAGAALPAGGRPRRRAPPRRSGLPQAAVLRARLGGWLHDVGKIAIPDRILAKPGRARRRGVGGDARATPWSAREVVRRVPGLRRRRRRRCEQHHERWDGTRLPGRAARARRSPIEARIVAAADAYSAITSDRVYRRRARRAARASPSCGAAPAAHLDPRVVEALRRRAGARRGAVRARPAWPADRRRPAAGRMATLRAAAGVAEPVDAPDLGSGGVTRGSSSLPARMARGTPFQRSHGR